MGEQLVALGKKSQDRSERPPRRVVNQRVLSRARKLAQRYREKFMLQTAFNDDIIVINFQR